MKQTIGYLASDSMKGRATPGKELDEAAEFIAAQFKSFGLQPFRGSYFQNLDFCYLDLGPGNFISVVKGLETINFELKDDFVPYDFSGSRPAEGDIVFAGYGITAPEYNYDDYKDIDARGKIVVVLRQEPGQTDTACKLFEGPITTRYSGLPEKQKTAELHGAAGLLVIAGPLQYLQARPKEFIWPSLSKVLPKNSPPMDYCGNPERHIPVVQIGDKLINELFGDTDSLRRIQLRIEKTLQPGSYLVKGKSLAMNVSITSTPVGGRNVIGWLTGSDPALKDEAIVVGAHYDHIGVMKDHDAEADYIFNGADDNASGTSGMLAVAKAFSSMVETPKRSVIFIAFAGEEKGLLGSETYVRKPLWPLEKTMAMFNLDMIGRNYPDSLFVIGARQNPGLLKVLKKENKTIGFALAESNRKEMEGGSDHVSFFRKDVPVIFFFTGFHEDYHKVTDSPEKINADKAARVARLAFLTAWTVSNENKHYKIDKSTNSRREN
jgi:hypothetical protein